MSRIIIEFDDETGNIAIDGSEGELSNVEILGILAMCTSIIVQSDTRPADEVEHIQRTEIVKSNKNKKRFDA